MNDLVLIKTALRLIRLPLGRQLFVFSILLLFFRFRTRPVGRWHAPLCPPLPMNRPKSSRRRIGKIRRERFDPWQGGGGLVEA